MKRFKENPKMCTAGKRFSLLMCAALLSACSHSEPGIEVRTVEVPVPVACLPADKIPAEPARVGDRLTGEPAVDLAIVSSSALALRAWGQTMHAALTACAAD